MNNKLITIIILTIYIIIYDFNSENRLLMSLQDETCSVDNQKKELIASLKDRIRDKTYNPDFFLYETFFKNMYVFLDIFQKYKYVENYINKNINEYNVNLDINLRKHRVYLNYATDIDFFKYLDIDYEYKLKTSLEWNVLNNNVFIFWNRNF